VNEVVALLRRGAEERQDVLYGRLGGRFGGVAGWWPFGNGAHAEEVRRHAVKLAAEAGLDELERGCAEFVAVWHCLPGRHREAVAASAVDWARSRGVPAAVVDLGIRRPLRLFGCLAESEGQGTGNLTDAASEFAERVGEVVRAADAAVTAGFDGVRASLLLALERSLEGPVSKGAFCIDDLASVEPNRAVFAYELDEEVKRTAKPLALPGAERLWGTQRAANNRSLAMLAATYDDGATFGELLLVKT
jgi:hypothetical protein